MSTCLSSLRNLLSFEEPMNETNEKDKVKKHKQNKPNSQSIFLVKNFCRKSEKIINNSSKINSTIDIKNNMAMSFYSELAEVEEILIRLNKQLSFIKKDFQDSFYTRNLIFQRSIACLEFNITFLLQIFQLFSIESYCCSKGDFFKWNFNASDNNEANGTKEKIKRMQMQRVFCIQKILILNQYFYTVINFHKLREKFDGYYYLKVEEENRFIFALRKFFKLKEVLAKPSKMGLLYLRTLKFYVWKIIKSINGGFSSIMNSVKFGYYMTKINFFCYVSADFLIVKENNLFEKDHSDKRWQDIYSNLRVELIGGLHRAKLARYFANFSTTFISSVYYLTDFDKFKYDLPNIFKVLVSSIMLVLFPRVRKYNRLYNTIHHNLEMTKLVFNTPEMGFIRVFCNVVREKSCIEKSFSVIDFGRYVKYIPSWFKNMEEFKQTYKFKLLANFQNEFDEENFNTNKNILKNARIAETIFRINYKKPNFSAFKENFEKAFLNLDILKRETIKKNMIFCLHGGGFIAQNSHSHLGYYCHIINNTDTFVIAFDYKLAPKNTLDKMIDECNRAFDFIYFLSEKLFGIEIQNYVLMGDSAGGFLAMNLANHIIRQKYKKPSALVLLYPCCRVIFDEMCPSNCFALTDLMIDTPFLCQLLNINIKMEDYYSEKLHIDEKYDIFETPEAIIKQYPKTLIVLGSTDPIRDECYKLADFLMQKEVKVELREFLFFNHGFMSLSSYLDPYYLPAVDFVKEKIFEVFNNLQ